MTIRKIIMCALVGLFILALLILVYLPRPTMATEPTPTPIITPLPGPPDVSGDGVCHLELGMKCDFINPFGIVMNNLDLRTNPVMGARGVPTYTLVSITFDEDMDAGRINNNTFYIEQGSTRLSGSVDYIPVSRLAVFYSDEPLRPDTTYTATVTRGVQDLAGEPLTNDVVWTFTTAVGPLLLGNDITTVGASSASGMQVYFGDLHTHSGYSDGQGTPADAFATARAKGADFLALTDHAFMLTEAEWQDTLNQANIATKAGQFVALPGFEFTHAQGHINVFGSDTFVHRDDPQYYQLENFYAWLAAHPTAIGQFNHPLKNQYYDWNFNNFAYHAAADQKMVLRELSNTEQFFLSLNAGWHVGTLLGSDTHQANWGAQRYVGLVASGLTKEAVLEALKARRTFYVSPNGQNFALAMQANGYWMGSAIPKTSTLNFTITAHDPSASGSPLRLALYDNGVRVAQAALPGAVSYIWTYSLSARLGHYYYTEAYYDDWWVPAYSSPIWVEQPPMAKAGASQAVAPGAVVTLDGSSSWDPDGDALAYHWARESGPLVSLNGGNTAWPTFTAPDTLGNAVFRLTVTDPGSLSDTDTTVVTVTDKPILSITKSGPTTARPGELITYVLTITNSGITTATGVVITDAVPVGATYIDGGTLTSGNIVLWELPSLAANGGVVQVTFAVTTNQGIANNDYRVSCTEGVSAVGTVTVFTNWHEIYLPVIMKAH